MAENNALTFYVQFKEDKQNSIEALVKQVKDTFEKTQIHLKGENIKIDGLEKTFNSVTNLLEQVEKKFKETGNISMGGNLETSFNNLADAISKVASAITSLETHIAGFSSSMSTSIVNAIVGNMENLGKATQKAKQALNEFNKEESKTKGATPKADVKAYTDEINRLKTQLLELKKIRSEALSRSLDKNGLMQTAEFKELEGRIQKIKEYITWVNEAKKAQTSLSEVQGKFESFAIPGKAAQETENLVSSLTRAVSVTNEMARSQERMGQAMQSAIDKASRQSQVLSDLKSMAAQYLSVWGASNFVKEVAQITGELELQQKSLEVIIGSASKAGELFSDIKGMSQMSPYTFQDLLKSTRQLAAFGIETKDLYKTMKQLSDIGAGLDVDVQRLILAYGHIKSAGVLQGIQRRQLETAGIGITAELAKLYNEQYRMSGSTERVSAEDVFKRIKDRAVPFEDVQKVFDRLTGPGGKFENMQLKQYETLGGKLRNLRNNYNIMMDEIGKAHMGLLTGGVNALNSLMENWRTWGKVIKDVIAALAAAKVAQMALGKTFAAHSAANAAQLAAARESIIIGNVNQGNIFGRYAPNLRTPQLGTGYAREVLKNKDLTRFQKVQTALYANVSKEAGNLILKEQGLNEKYQSRIAAMKKMANSTNPARAAFGRLQLGFQRLDWSARQFFNTMKTGFASLMANPMLWIGAAVAGITAVIQSLSELNEQEKNITKNIKETSASDIKSLKQELDPLKDALRLTDEVGNFDGKPGKFVLDREKFAKEDPKNIIETLDEQLQKYDPLYKGTLFDLKAMQSEADKVEAMINNLDIIARAKQKMADTAGALAAANKESGGVGRDTFLKEAKELEDEYLKISNFIDAHEEELEARMRELTHIPAAKLREESGLAGSAKDYREFFKRMGDMNFGEALKKDILAGHEWHIPVDADIQLDTHDLITKVEALKRKAVPIIAQLKKNIRDLKNEDETGELRASYLEQTLDSLLSQDETALSDPKYVDWVKEQLMTMLDDAFVAMSPQAAEDFRENVLAKLASAKVKAKAGEFFEQEKGMGNVIPEMTPEQIEALRERFKKQVYDAMIDGVSDEKEKRRLKDAFNGVFDTAIESFTGEGLEGWQRKIKDALHLLTFDDIKVKLGIDVTSKSDISEVIKETRKKFDECKKIVSDTFGSSLKSMLNISIDPAVSFGSVKEMKRLREQIIKRLQEKMPTKEGFGAFAIEGWDPVAWKVAKSVLKELDTMISIFDIKESTGIDTVGRNKDAEKADKAAQTAAEKARRAQEAAARKAEAEERRQWNKRMQNLSEQISMISEARNEYKKWEKDLSKDSALEMVKKNFEERGLYGVGKIFEPGDLDNVEDFASLLAKVEKKIKDLKAATKDPDRLDQLDAKLKEVAKAASDNAYLIFSEGSEKYLREYGKQLDELTRKWERYNSVLEKTGDEKSGMVLSGLSQGSVNAGFYAEDLKSLFSSFKGIGKINFKAIAGLDEKGIEDYAKELIGKFETDENGKKILKNAQQVQALIKALKEYKKAITDLDKRSIDAFSSASASAVDYASQVKRINAALETQINLINRLEGISSTQKKVLTGRLETQGAWDKWEKSNDYSMMMNNNAGMSTNDFFKAFEKTRDLLLEKLGAGLITPADYAKSMEELFSKRSDYQKERAAGFMDFDPINRMERAFKQAMTEFQRASDKYQEAQTQFNNVSIRLAELEGLQTRAINLTKDADLFDQMARLAEKDGNTEKAEEFRAEADKLRAEAEEVSVQANSANLEIQNLKFLAPKYQEVVTSAKKDVDKSKDKVDNITRNKTKEENTRNGVQKTIEALNRFGDALDFTTKVLKSFGIDSAAAEDASMVAKSTAEGASVVGGLTSALDATGPYGAIAGAAIGLVSGLFQMRDAALQRKIDAIKLDTTKMSNTLETIKALRERQLGYDTGAARSILASYYKNQYGIVDYGEHYRNRYYNDSAASAMYEYYTRYNRGSGYEQELKLLEEQREKLIEMYNLEDQKKDKSKEDLEDYTKQIAELDEQIQYYIQDIAKELWDIDIKGWADQIGDALMTAFENGSSAAAAFKDTVQDIMRSMVKNMMVVGVIEPALKDLQEKLFGKDGKSGIFGDYGGIKNAEQATGAVLSALASWFKDEGPALMDAANEYFNGADDLLKQVLGYGLKESDRASNTVNSITSTASEETMGVVAGYLARISQDVSVQRIIQEMYVNGTMPSFVEQVTTANNSLTAIDRSTTAMMEMMRDGNGALYERVENMSRRLDNFANGIDRIYVN